MSDYGADPLGNGLFRLVPSGDVVDWDERCRRLPLKQEPLPDGVFGRSWEQIERLQRGRIKHG